IICGVAGPTCRRRFAKVTTVMPPVPSGSESHPGCAVTGSRARRPIARNGAGRVSLSADPSRGEAGEVGLLAVLAPAPAAVAEAQNSALGTDDGKPIRRSGRDDRAGDGDIVPGSGG